MTDTYAVDIDEDEVLILASAVVILVSHPDERKDRGGVAPAWRQYREWRQ